MPEAGPYPGMRYEHAPYHGRSEIINIGKLKKQKARRKTSRRRRRGDESDSTSESSSDSESDSSNNLSEESYVDIQLPRRRSPSRRRGRGRDHDRTRGRSRSRRRHEKTYNKNPLGHPPIGKHREKASQSYNPKTAPAPQVHIHNILPSTPAPNSDREYVRDNYREQQRDRRHGHDGGEPRGQGRRHEDRDRGTRHPSYPQAFSPTSPRHSGHMEQPMFAADMARVPSLASSNGTTISSMSSTFPDGPIPPSATRGMPHYSDMRTHHGAEGPLPYPSKGSLHRSNRDAFQSDHNPYVYADNDHLPHHHHRQDDYPPNGKASRRNRRPVLVRGQDALYDEEPYPSAYHSSYPSDVEIVVPHSARRPSLQPPNPFDPSYDYRSQKALPDPNSAVNAYGVEDIVHATVRAMHKNQAGANEHMRQSSRKQKHGKARHGRGHSGEVDEWANPLYMAHLKNQGGQYSHA